MDPERYPCSINSIDMCIHVNHVDWAAKTSLVQDQETGLYVPVGVSSVILQVHLSHYISSYTP
jgi:hypothetical protein